jgi:endonuclease/exonuclease/phosphatase family metal-dependent hydrolase
LSKLIKKVLRILNFLLAGGLALSYLTPHIPPDRFWPVAFLGLVFPALIVINAGFVVFWISRKNWLFLLSLLVLVIGINPISRNYQFAGLEKDTAANTEEGVMLLSYNVRAFGMFESKHFGPDQERIFELIREKDPEVVCFQEFYVNQAKGLTINKIDSLLPGLPYHHVVWLSKGENRQYGIATFSKYPIVKKGRVVFDRTYNASIFSDFLINKQRIRVFNNHLQSIRFNRSNYRFITNQSQYDDSEKLKALQDISFRLRDAYIKRSQQAEEISTHIRRSPFPVLVCGDFNDTPLSYTYKTMRHQLKDAFVEAGSGMGITYKGQFPSFRIDYIFYDSTFQIRHFEVGEKRYSDHYPVMARFGVKKETL